MSRVRILCFQRNTYLLRFIVPVNTKSEVLSNKSHRSIEPSFHILHLLGDGNRLTRYLGGFTVFFKLHCDITVSYRCCFGEKTPQNFSADSFGQRAQRNHQRSILFKRIFIQVCIKTLSHCRFLRKGSQRTKRRQRNKTRKNRTEPSFHKTFLLSFA